MNIKISDKAMYFAAGCGIGVALGALLAPKSGSEMRQNLSNKVDDLTQKVQDRLQSSGIGDAASRTWNTVVEQGRNVANIGSRRIRESVEAARQRFSESMEDDDLAER